MIIVLYCKLKVQMDYTIDKDIVFVDIKVLENEVSRSSIMIGDFFDSHIKLLSPKLSFILLLMIQFRP